MTLEVYNQRQGSSKNTCSITLTLLMVAFWFLTLRSRDHAV